MYKEKDEENCLDAYKSDVRCETSWVKMTGKWGIFIVFGDGHIGSQLLR